MPKIRKLLILLVILLLLPLIYSNIVHDQQVGNFSFELIRLEDYPYIGDYLTSYLFWASMFLVIILIVLFLLVFLRPKNITEISMSKSKGNLLIKKNAVESFVLLALSKESWLVKPVVSIKMKKRKIKIDISGTCCATESNLIEKTEFLSNRIKEELVNFLGLETEKQVSVQIQKLSTEETKVSRVV